jgi:hypothetical protein
MKAAAIAWNARLALGLLIAWAFSAATLFAWIRRLPARVVLLRRRLRNPASAGSPAPANPASLLAQNNALPGNRVDGFRFHHLRLMIVLTPLYLWLELSFGVSLLDKMGSSLPIDATAAVEHWGRLISGLALALVFLKGWLAQCEKWDRSWPVRIGVSVVIVVLSFFMMWQVQDAVIEFHVTRASSEIAIALTTLAVVIVAGFLLVRTWLRRSMANRRRGVLATLAGLAALCAAGAVVLAYLNPLISAITRKTGVEERIVHELGLERQRAAKLTVMRRGLQLGHYEHANLPVQPAAVDSAEGKAALALFPIVAANLDPAFFQPDQERVVGELMYHDWERDNGDAAYAAYQASVKELEDIHAGPYAEASQAFETMRASQGREAAEAAFTREVRGLLEGGTAPPGLSLAEFVAHPAALRYLRMAAACNECELRHGMPRDAYTRELHKWTEKENVKTTIGNLESSEHFETGKDGESAARTYWVPIWALLFSMVGAVVHLFKMAFTLTEYVQRRAFQAVGAADSTLARRVVGHSRRLIALGILALSLFIFFSDNRVTGTETYAKVHRAMWMTQPVVGAVAAHWTINAQGLVYPFTRKFRPDWLDFDSDPLAWMPFAAQAEKNKPDDSGRAPRGASR